MPSGNDQCAEARYSRRAPGNRVFFVGTHGHGEKITGSVAEGDNVSLLGGAAAGLSSARLLRKGETCEPGWYLVARRSFQQHGHVDYDLARGEPMLLATRFVSPFTAASSMASNSL
jgi:hypothetical protein